jgi:hypothetical protein
MCGYAASPRDKKMIEHLRDVERSLEFGAARKVVTYEMRQDEDGDWYIYENVLQFCGGYRHFLGRDLADNDTIRLRPLRDLVLLKNRQAPDFDGYAEEWLSEFSLEVTPAA